MGTGLFSKTHMGQRRSRYRTLNKRLFPRVGTLGLAEVSFHLFLERSAWFTFIYLFKTLHSGRGFGHHGWEDILWTDLSVFFFFWLEEPKLASVFFKKRIVQDVGMVHWCRICLMTSTAYSLIWISCTRCPGGKLTYVCLSATANSLEIMHFR